MILSVCPNPSVDNYIWIENIDPGKVHRASCEKKFPGGKGVHLAIAVAELGEEVTLLGFWGGETGKWIKNECKKKNIKCIGPELTEWSRSCFTFKSDSIYDDTELLGCGPKIKSDEYKAFINCYTQIIEKADAIAMSGSWPKGAPPNGYGELIQYAKKINKCVILDATGDFFKKGLVKEPYAIHLNYAESQSFTKKNSIPEIIKYFRKFSELVAITVGKDGLYLGLGNSIIHGNVKLENIYSAVGSGDCLTAGIAIGITKKRTAEELVKTGVACGAANCLREDLGMFYKRDVESLLEMVEINYIL